VITQFLTAGLPRVPSGQPLLLRDDHLQAQVDLEPGQLFAKRQAGQEQHGKMSLFQLFK
jgi:hypothetical protein